MIASSLQEGDELVDLLLNKGADVDCKSLLSLERLGSKPDADG